MLNKNNYNSNERGITSAYMTQFLARIIVICLIHRQKFNLQLFLIASMVLCLVMLPLKLFLTPYTEIHIEFVEISEAHPPIHRLLRLDLCQVASILHVSVSLTVFLKPSTQENAHDVPT